MYTSWPFFREMVDLIAMTLSKTDYSIANNYETQLVDSKDEELKQVGEGLRQRLLRTRQSVLGLTGCEDLSSGFQLLRQSMKVRNPYVDPLNVMQAEMMKRLRAANAAAEAAASASTSASGTGEKQILEDALVVSINGVAQGLKNSG
jgi:phosphoenolpyruvate carboxylase